MCKRLYVEKFYLQDGVITSEFETVENAFGCVNLAAIKNLSITAIAKHKSFVNFL